MSEEKGISHSKLTGGHVIKGGGVLAILFLIVQVGLPLFNAKDKADERSEAATKKAEAEAVWRESMKEARRITLELNDQSKEKSKMVGDHSVQIADLANKEKDLLKEDIRLRALIDENTDWRIEQEKRATQRVKDQEYREERLTEAEAIIKAMRKKDHNFDLQLLELNIILKHLTKHDTH